MQLEESFENDVAKMTSRLTSEPLFALLEQTVIWLSLKQAIKLYTNLTAV